MTTKFIHESQLQQTTFSVSELNRKARVLLESQLAQVRVQGEISNFMQARSGHCYFSLKDDAAQVRCVLFNGHYRRLKLELKDGMEVIARGNISLYEARGDYQLLVENIQETGDGALRRAFLKLYEKLQGEGLFDAAHKKVLPQLPKQIGVITSPTGAAIHDILTTLKRRFPAIPVVIYPTLVQGEQAADQIVDAIELANQRGECDVLLIARGGGSLEDLWPFNEARVAYAVFNSQIPTVTGIGHEVDTTIADFVADVRAATPTAAAETVTPNQADWISRVQTLEQQLMQIIKFTLSNAQQQLQLLHQKLPHPLTKLQQHMITCDHIQEKLQRMMKHRLQSAKQNLTELTRALDAVSPLRTLARGYAIATTADNHILRSSNQVKLNDEVHVRLHEGRLVCGVIKKSSHPGAVRSTEPGIQDPKIV